VESLSRWWHAAGLDAYPQARRLLVTADAGGSNGYRTRAWKSELAELAARAGLEITVCHFPPGTSKWNAIECRALLRSGRDVLGRGPQRAQQRVQRLTRLDGCIVVAVQVNEQHSAAEPATAGAHCQGRLADTGRTGQHRVVPQLASSQSLRHNTPPSADQT
jgi:hypothetical protein